MKHLGLKKSPNTHNNFVELKVTSADVLCVQKSQNKENVHFSMYDKEKQPILLLERLESENIWHRFSIFA